MRKLANWHLILCGINHKNSTSEERGPLRIGNDDIAAAHALLSGLPGVMEAVIVSTCNRIEFYFVWDKGDDPLDLIQFFYKKLKNLDIRPLSDKFYIKKGKHVAEHLFKVTAGMDSMALGENEILGQVKAAYSSSCSVKAAGRVIHRMFHQAFRAGKRVRTETEMGKGACSVSTAAVGLVKSKVEKTAHPDILFIGINKMISHAASAFDKGHHGKLIFANRTVSNIEEISNRYKAERHSLDNLAELISDVDIVFTCTGSPEPIITRGIIDRAIAINKSRFEEATRKLIIMDIAAPRNVDIENGYDNSIEIYYIEDVENYIRELQDRQKLAIPQAMEIIDRLMGEFGYWYDHIKFEPMYNGLGNTFEEIRRQELSRILEKLPDDLKDEVENATGRLTNRLLHLKMRTSEKEN